jgi:hypothetical protein
MKPVLNLLRNLTLVATLTIATLLVAEYAIRWLIPVPDLHQDAVRLFTHSRPGLPDFGMPNSEARMARVGEYDIRFRFNSHGLRDKRDITKARADEIIFLGDSQTFGFGVQTHERFSDLVGDKLGVATYNLAVPTDILGYKQLLEFAVKNGARAQRLVVGLSMETDILPYSRSERSESATNAPAGVSEGPAAVDGMAKKVQPAAPADNALRTRLLPLKRWLSYNSALYFTVANFVRQWPVLQDLAVDANLITPAVYVWDPEIIERTVAALQDLCSGYECTIAIIPSRGLWTSKDPQAERGHEALVGMLRVKGLTVVDPRAEMESGGAPLDYFFLVDGHINGPGNALLAEMITREIIAGSGPE